MTMIRKMSTEENLYKVAKHLMYNRSFMGFFLSTLNKQIIRKGDVLYKKISTAAVGKDPDAVNYTLYINEDFWLSMTQEEQMDILTHELMHIVLFHPTMSKSFKEKEIFNIAADLEINQELPSIAAQGMSHQEYIDFCKEHAEVIKSGAIVAPFRGCVLEDYGFDSKTELRKGTKYYYNKLMAMANDDKDQSQAAQNLRAMVDAMKSGSPVGPSHDTWKDFAEASDADNELMDENTKHTIKQIYEGNKSTIHGNIPGYLRDLIDSMMVKRAPVFNWQAALRRFASYSTEYYTKSTRKKLNKRNPEFSTIKMKNKQKIFVGLDTSGSMSNEDIKLCFAEVDHMYKAGVAIEVGECDAALNREEDVYSYKGKYPKNRKGLSGGGGTSVRPLIDYVNDHAHEYSCFIYLTDGYMGDPGKFCKKPMMTILVPDGADTQDLQSRKQFGRVIKMNRGHES